MTDPATNRAARRRHRLIALVDDFAGLRVAVFGDLHRRRVHLRRDRAGLARSAGADPQLRLDRDRAGRRRQRRQQRRRARRRPVVDRSRRARRSRGRGCWRCSATSTSYRRACGRAATGRRPRRGSWPAACTRPSSRSCGSTAPPAPSRRRSIAGRLEGKLVRAAAAAMRCWSPTTAPAWCRRRCVTPRARRAPTAGAAADAGRLALRAARFRGMTTCTPNESEVEQLFGVRIGENVRVLEHAGRELLRADPVAGGAGHPRQPRHGAVRARPADHAHPHLRLGPDRRRHRRRRHRDRHHDAGAGRRARRSRRRRTSPTTPAGSSS